MRYHTAILMVALGAFGCADPLDDRPSSYSGRETVTITAADGSTDEWAVSPSTAFIGEAASEEHRTVLISNCQVLFDIQGSGSANVINVVEPIICTANSDRTGAQYIVNVTSGSGLWSPVRFQLDLRGDAESSDPEAVAPTGTFTLRYDGF